MPRVGMRLIKTIIAVLISLYVSMLIGGAGTPIYAGIATVLCMQPDVNNSFKAGMGRLLGTIIGASLGLVCLLIEQALGITELLLLQYLFVAFFTGLSIYATVLIKQPSISFISCVVLLNVTLVPAGGMPPAQIAISRSIGTIVGIFVALAVNMFRLPRFKNKDTLFIVAAEGVLLNKNGEMDTRNGFALNLLFSQGMNLMLTTKYSPALIIPQIEEIQYSLPMVVLNGAAMYDPITRNYFAYDKMSKPLAQSWAAQMVKQDVCVLQYVIDHGQVHAYYTGNYSVPEKPLIERLQKSQNTYFVSDAPLTGDLLMLYCTAPKQICMQIYEKTHPLIPPEYKLRLQKNNDIAGFYEISVHKKKRSFDETLQPIKASVSCTKTIILDYREKAPLYCEADYSLLVSSEITSLPTAYTGIIQPNKTKQILSKLFHSRSPLTLLNTSASSHKNT